MLLEKSDGGRGSGGAPDLLRVPAPRAGVLGMPGRCSQEKGTAEARSGERKRWWNGEGAGEKGAKEKEAEEEDADDADEDEEVGADEGFGDARRRCRRRLDADLRAGAGSGDGEEGVGGLGLGIAKLWPWLPVVWSLGAQVWGLWSFMVGSWRRRARKWRRVEWLDVDACLASPLHVGGGAGAYGIFPVLC